MFRKLLSILAMSSILLVSSSLAFGKKKGDWVLVQGLTNQEVAIKTKGGQMHYGIIKSADASSLVLRTVSDTTVSTTETTFKKNEIAKIWRALLFVNDRNIGKGALIGAGVGAVALGVPAVAQANRESFGADGLEGAAFILGALAGAAVGGVVGFFAKKKHRKRDLVFQQ